jgi:hypothetical protein
MAESQAVSADEFVRRSRRAESCATMASTLRSMAETDDSLLSMRNAATLLARSLGDSRWDIGKYGDILSGIGELSDVVVIGDQTYESGPAAAFEIAAFMIRHIWFTIDPKGMPLTWTDPLRAEHIRLDPKSGEIDFRQPAPFDADRLLSDDLDDETLKDVRVRLTHPCYQFSSRDLISRIRRERPRVLVQLAASNNGAESTARNAASEPAEIDSRLSTNGAPRLLSTAPRPFCGGQMVFSRDRVELCGADICSGPRQGSRRIVLELLSRRRREGSFVAYSGDALEARAKELGAEGTAVG